MGLWKLMSVYKIFILFLWTLCKTEGSKLSEFINKYEVLKYDTHLVHHQHLRVKRSLDPNKEELKIVFDSHGKFFHLRLRRDVTTISANVQVEMPSHLGTLDTSHIYEGTLADEHNSRVWGNVRGGVFDGVIESGRDGVFYVEHAHKYFPRHNSTEAGFHSVIYHDDNVHDPYSHLRRGHATGCGMTDEIEGWMENVQYGSSPDDGEENVVSDCGETTEGGGEEEHYLPPEYKKLADNLALHSVSDNYLLKEKYKKIAKQLKKDYHDKYSASSNINSIHSSSSSRVKRSLLGVGANNRGTCTLSIQTDPMLWHYIHDKKSNDVDRTKDDITAMISQHVKAINNIYGDVIFEGRYKHQGIRFEVQRIKIDDDSLCGIRQGGEMYKFCRTNVDVSNFLNLHSKTNHDDFCLAYVFTFRDFTGGTLGLAWVASPSGASGGICEKYKTYTENLAGFRHTEQRSLNTGIITFLNYNNRVPPKVSQLTLAHEIGHNFGSPHDYPERCKPGGLQGNYIMFSSATSGDRPNNSKFSPCSVRNITKVLDAIIENRRKNCFKATDGAFCGNKIVEQGEECDCGYDDNDCDETCCYPKLISKADKARDPNAKPCTRRNNTQCSPSEGPCCNRNSCRFISGMECHAPTDCTLSSSCNGYNASCPKPRARSNLTFCNEDTKVCLNGECSGSICLAHNMQECFLTSDIVQDKKELCKIACQINGIPNSCKSTSDLHHKFNSTVFMRPGAPCNNFQGYCDVFQKCRAVDAEGPLARLKNLLFSQDTLNSLAEWITQYWYGVLLIGVAFVVVMGMFIRCCAVHTPSSNPNKPAARSITETLRRPVNTIRRVKRHRTAQGPTPNHHHHHSNHHHHHHADRQLSYQHHQLHNQPGPSRGNRNSREVAPKPSPSEPSSNRASRSYTDDPPPPYPGSRPPPTRHGYGEGRGHYNRPKGGKRHENSAV